MIPFWKLQRWMNGMRVLNEKNIRPRHKPERSQPEGKGTFIYIQSLFSCIRRNYRAHYFSLGKIFCERFLVDLCMCIAQNIVHLGYVWIINNLCICTRAEYYSSSLDCFSNISYRWYHGGLHSAFGCNRLYASVRARSWSVSEIR